MLPLLLENQENSRYRYHWFQNLYTYPVTDVIYIGEESGNLFLKLSWQIYIYIYSSRSLYVTVIHFHGAVFIPLIFVTFE